MELGKDLKNDIEGGVAAERFRKIKRKICILPRSIIWEKINNTLWKKSGAYLGQMIYRTLNDR